MKTTVARNVQGLRRARGWTQKELAEKSGLSYHAVVSYENGLRVPSGRSLVSLERCLGVAGAQIIGGGDNYEVSD